MRKTAKINGFTLVESLMAVLIFSLSGLAFSSFVTISANTQSKNKAKMTVAQSKGQILAMIANRSTWYKNIKDAGKVRHPSPIHQSKFLNPELACIRDGTLCTETTSGYPLSLTDQNGQLVVDAIDTTKGLTREGAVCTGFSEETPNLDCPWRMNLTWNPICPTSAPCKHPQVTINVTISASDAFLQANNLTTTQVSVLVEQPKVAPAFARKILFLTNSLHYGYPSTLTIDPSPYVVTESPGTLTYTLPRNVSQRGGKVSLSGGRFIYSPEYDASITPTPDEQIYGTDWFTYKITDSYTGIETVATAYIQVMTPYTWTGLAGGGDRSFSANKNFCGKVVNNVCDGTTFPGGFFASTKDTNLVFNETCTVCDAVIDAPTVSSSFETSPYYAGTITQQANFVAGGYTYSYGHSVWRKTASYRFTSGIWDGQAGTLIIPRRGEKYACYMCQVPLYTYFRLEGGTFKAPPMVQVLGSLYMPSPTAFQHNNGTFHWIGDNQYGSVGCAGDCYTGSEDVQFNHMIVGYPKNSPTDSNFNIAGFTVGLSWQRRTYIENGFTVLGNLTVANVANEAQLATYKPSAVIKLYGNYILPTPNAGGDYSYGNPSTILMTGTQDQMIVGQNLSDVERKVYDNQNCGPGITVDKPSGKLTMKDLVCFGGDMLLKNAGSFVMDKVGLAHRGYKWDVPVVIDMKGQEVDGLYYMSGVAMSLRSDIIANKMLYINTPHSSIGSIRNETEAMRYIHVRGDAEFGPLANHTAYRAENAATILFDGSGDQTFTGQMTNNRAIINHINVNKSSGRLTFNGSLGSMQDFLINGGDVVFGPDFSLQNVMTGADFIRTRIRLNNPANQVFAKILSRRTIEALTPVYVKDLELNSIGNWVGSHYTNLFGGASQPFYVSGNLTFGNVDRSSGGYVVDIYQALINARSGTQKVILNGTGAQRIEILGENTSGSGATLDLQIQNTGTGANRVTIAGNGQIRNMTVAAGTTVDLDAASNLSLTGTVQGVLNKNGRMPTGSLTASGGGVINN